MNAFLRTSAVLLVLLAAAACASPNASADQPAGGAGSSSPPVTSGPVNPPAAGGPPEAMQPNTTTPDARAVALRPHAFDRVERHGRQLRIHYTTTGKPACSALGRVDVRQGADAVTVTLLTGRLPGTSCGGATPQLAASNVTVVTLDAPIGDRAVRDGAAGSR